jgi:hypothetical protein
MRTRPSEIILFRHGEEPADPLDPDLSAAGRTRAERLAVYLPKAFGVPDLLIAAASNRASARSYLTMRPLGIAMKMRVWTQLRANQTLELADGLFSNPDVRGRKVFVCWTHTEIPSLAKALGAAKGDYPAVWDESTFDLILRFRYHGKRPRRLAQITQPF